MPPARALLYLSTAGAIVLAGRSALIEPVPLGWALAAAAGYSAIVLCGVFFLRLRMFVNAVVRGPDGARGVALTFDDGPHEAHTRKVLDALDRANATATFFVIAKKAEKNVEVVREIVRRGHAVGLHSYAHDRLFALRSSGRVRADLERGLEAIERITGVRPSLFRPPVGHTNPAIARVADELGLLTIGWTVRGLDGVPWAREERVVQRVKTGLGDGAIVMMHDAAEEGEREPAGVRALPAVLMAIAEARLEVVALERFIEHRG
jgi:peptidoglycan/xylan/chitin deacetylase (PgdA/CDA1 family)